MNFFVLIIVLFLPLTVSAQSINFSTSDSAIDNPAEAIQSQSRLNQSRYINYGKPQAEESADRDPLPVYGSQLFGGGFGGVRSDGLNQAYRITTVDQIVLRVWGAVTVDTVLAVDSLGNIFLPSIGPVAVAGVPQSQLDQVVRRAVKSLYPQNVRVYTNLLGIQPVSVFVTGFVEAPGRYSGTPNDSVLYFMHLAGGIDDELGSYRRIEIRRDNTTLKVVDLYPFINEGYTPNFQFEDGDTIFVTKRKPSISVRGDVAIPGRFELHPEQSLDEIASLSRPLPSANNVLIRGFRDQKPFASYTSIKQLSTFMVHDGDKLLVTADEKPDSIVVRIEGSFEGPSVYTVPRDAKLSQLLETISIDGMFADINSVSIKRLDVQRRQKASIEESLRRLEATYLGASSATNEEAGIRVKEAELIQRFINKAKQVKPTGRLVVSYEDEIRDIRLQDGDVITIPEKSDSLLISGEVLVPQSMVYQPDLDVKDYIRAAGGLTRHADKKRLLVVRQNGEVREAKDVELRGGDEILVLPKAPTKNLQLAGSISQIVYQIAIAARVALDV